MGGDVESIIGPILILALMDMVNPSAIAVTIYLLLTSTVAHVRVLSYAAGMVSAYLVTGFGLMLGLGQVQPALESPVTYAIEGAIGAVLFAYSWIMPRTGQGEPSVQTPRSLAPAALFALGVTVTMVELVTAVPYLGAITLMTRAGLTATQWLPILLLYNVLFVMPPVALMVAYIATGRSDRSNPEAVLRAGWPVNIAQRARGAELGARGHRLSDDAERCGVLRVLRPGRPAGALGKLRAVMESAYLAA